MPQPKPTFNTRASSKPKHANTYRGVLLIGGESKRMGTPKQLLDIHGEPLGKRLADRLQRATGAPPLLLGQGPIWPEGEELERIEDREAGAGPLSAMMGLFQAVPQSDFLVLACDLPLMTTAALDWLVRCAGRETANFIWPCHPGRTDGEPLSAVYRAGASVDLEEAWQRGVRGLIRAVPSEARAQPQIPPDHLAAFTGANNPKSLAALLAGRELKSTQGARDGN